MLLVAQSAADHQYEFTSAARLLLGIVTRIAPSVDACGDDFRQLAADSKWLKAISISDPNGMLVCSSGPLSPGTSVADRPYFKDVMRTHGFVMSDYVMGRVHKAPVVLAAAPRFDHKNDIELGHHFVDRSDLARSGRRESRRGRGRQCHSRRQHGNSRLRRQEVARPDGPEPRAGSDVPAARDERERSSYGGGPRRREEALCVGTAFRHRSTAHHRLSGNATFVACARGRQKRVHEEHAVLPHTVHHRLDARRAHDRPSDPDAYPGRLGVRQRGPQGARRSRTRCRTISPNLRRRSMRPRTSLPATRN